MIPVGARVRIRPGVMTAHSRLRPGDTGTVVEDGGHDGWVSVHFDKYFAGHSCEGRCPEGHGWILLEIDFEELPQDSPEFLEWCELGQAEDT